MRIGGFQPFTLSDFPGRVAAIVFTQGCNMRCGYCHNKQLIPTDPAQGKLVPIESIFGHLRNRAGQVDGIVVTGGEPTIQPDLPDFLRRLKTLGFAVKLDTNGSRPDMLETLIEKNLLDFIALDIKAPPQRYSRLTGIDLPTATLEKSIRIISTSGIDHEFRTTASPLLSAADLHAIADSVPAHSIHRIHPYQARIPRPMTQRLSPSPKPLDLVGSRTGGPKP